MFGVAGVYVAAGEGNLCHGGVEVLVLQLADGAAVHRVGPVGAEALNVELMGALADFLVRVEGYSDFTVLDFGMLLQVIDGTDDFGDAGLVVGAQEGGAVGNDKVLAYIVVEFGKVGGREDDALGLAEHDVAAGIVLYDAGVDMAPAHVGRCVQMGDEAYDGHFLVRICRKGGHQVAGVLEADFGEAHLAELVLEILGEYHLPGGARGHIGEFVALGVELHVAEKSVY